jgi:hypothetical protein
METEMVVEMAMTRTVENSENDRNGEGSGR